MSDEDRRAEALGALRASAQLRDGKLVPAWSEVARKTGLPRPTLVRWWQTSHFAAPQDGELLDRAATVAQAKVEESMGKWIRPRLAGWRKMVERVTSDEMVEEVEALVETDPEAATRIVVMVGKILEAAPVIARLGDDGAPKGGTGRLDEVRRHLLGHSVGRALIGAR